MTRPVVTARDAPPSRERRFIGTAPETCMVGLPMPTPRERERGEATYQLLRRWINRDKFSDDPRLDGK